MAYWQIDVRIAGLQKCPELWRGETSPHDLELCVVQAIARTAGSLSDCWPCNHEDVSLQRFLCNMPRATGTAISSQVWLEARRSSPEQLILESKSISLSSIREYVNVQLQLAKAAKTEALQLQLAKGSYYDTIKSCWTRYNGDCAMMIRKKPKVIQSLLYMHVYIYV